MGEKITYKYTAFGYNIKSEIPIICFDESNFYEDYDIEIRIGETPNSLNNVIQEGSFYQAAENEFLLKVPFNANFYISNGNNVVVKPFENSKIEELSTFICGRILGILLHQRKLNPIHGSAIKYKNKVIAFAGISGSGKSTIIAAIEKKGGEIISDDLLLFKIDDSIKLIPSFPFIKLWQDAIRILNIDKTRLSKIRNEIGKYYYKVKNFAKTPEKVDYIIFLNVHNKNNYEIEEIYGHKKFNFLKETTYIFANVKKTGIINSNFKICSQLAKELPMFVLTRPSEIFEIEKMIKVIEKTLNL